MRKRPSSRLVIARNILDRNGLDFGARLSFDNTQVNWPDDPGRTADAVNTLISRYKPDVLRISYADIGAGVLGKLDLGSIEQVVLIGGAAQGFHHAAHKAKVAGLTPNEDASVPEIVLLEQKA